MTCNRCTDIHEAQKNGNTQQPCKCSCHVNYSTGGNTTWTDITNTSTNGTPSNVTYHTQSKTWEHQCPSSGYPTYVLPIKIKTCPVCNIEANDSTKGCFYYGYNE